MAGKGKKMEEDKKDAGEGTVAREVPPDFPEPMFDVGSPSSTAPSSLTAGLKVAKQAVKGTVMTTGYVTGRVVESSLQAAFDYTNQADEHFYATNVRATTRKSASRRTSYLVPWGFRGYLHPDFVGMALLGLGYTATTTGAGVDKTHAFTIASRNNAPWLSVIQRVGEGAGILERRVTDARLQGMTIDGNASGLVMAGSGFGLTEGLAVGTETTTLEPETLILPGSGALTSLAINGEQLLSPVRALRLQMTNALDTSEVSLWSFARADLAQAGVDFSGVLRGIDVTPDTYKLLTYGASGGTAPSTTCPLGALNFRFESPGVIPTAAVPYSIAFNLPAVEWRMSNIQAHGSQLIRFDLAFMMIDDGTVTPATITLVNTKASY